MIKDETWKVKRVLLIVRGQKQTSIGRSEALVAHQEAQKVSRRKHVQIKTVV